MVGELWLDTSHAPFCPCAFEGELIGGADEDEEDGDADRRHDHRLDQPRAVGHRRDVAEASGRHGDHREIDDVEETDMAVIAVLKPGPVAPVDEYDAADQQEGDAQPRGPIGPYRPAGDRERDARWKRGYGREDHGARGAIT